MRFDLIDMQLFLQIVETGSITAGAERMHLALASASARIRGMEETLGAPLLTRGRRGVAPTAVGRTLAHHARVLSQQMETMRGELGDYARGLKGTVRLLCNTAALAEFLPESLSAFMAEHPNIDIDLEERLSYDIVRAIAQGLGDVGIVADSADTTGLETFPFRVDRLVMVSAPSHPLAQMLSRERKRTVAFAETLDHDFIGLAGDSALQQYLSGQAARAGKRLKYRVRLRSFEAVCRLVENRIGISVLPETAAMRCQHSMVIRRFRLTDAWASRRLLICVRRFDSLPPYARQLIDAIKS
jgi:DNA-binding transcriptional LysR family regulator